MRFEDYWFIHYIKILYNFQVDYWSESEHEVFRVISDHLLSAIQHCHQIDPWSTLRHIVVRIAFI